jgi:MFS family permease
VLPGRFQALRLTTSLFLGCAIPVASLLIREVAPPERRGAASGAASSATSTGFALGFWAAYLVSGAARPDKKRPELWKAILAHRIR